MAQWIMNIILGGFAVLYCLSWTNILHPTYNFWGLLYWFGNL